MTRPFLLFLLLTPCSHPPRSPSVRHQSERECMCGYINTFIYTKQQERERETRRLLGPHSPSETVLLFFFFFLSFSQLSSTSLLLQMEGREKKKEGGRSSNPITIAPLFLSLAFLFPKSKKDSSHQKIIFQPLCVWVAEQYQSGISPAVDLL